MKNHDVLKERVAALEKAQKECEVAMEAVAKAERLLQEMQNKRCEATRNLAHAVWSKCSGKTMIYQGNIYAAIKQPETNLLLLDVKPFKGDVVD